MMTRLDLLDEIVSKALMGRKNSIPTIMIGNMDMELPAMYIMKRFIGSCLMGPKAMSQDLCSDQRSVLSIHVQVM